MAAVLVLNSGMRLNTRRAVPVQTDPGYVQAMRLFGLRLWRGSAPFPVTGEHLSCRYPCMESVFTLCFYFVMVWRLRV